MIRTAPMIRTGRHELLPHEGAHEGGGAGADVVAAAGGRGGHVPRQAGAGASGDEPREFHPVVVGDQDGLGPDAPVDDPGAVGGLQGPGQLPADGSHQGRVPGSFRRISSARVGPPDRSVTMNGRPSACPLS